MSVHIKMILDQKTETFSSSFFGGGFCHFKQPQPSHVLNQGFLSPRLVWFRAPPSTLSGTSPAVCQGF